MLASWPEGSPGDWLTGQGLVPSVSSARMPPRSQHVSQLMHETVTLHPSIFLAQINEPRRHGDNYALGIPVGVN